MGGIVRKAKLNEDGERSDDKKAEVASPEVTDNESNLRGKSIDVKSQKHKSQKKPKIRSSELSERYVIGKSLGEGSFAVVFKGTPKEVVLKELGNEDLDSVAIKKVEKIDASTWPMIEKEVQIMSEISNNSEHCVRFYEVFQNTGCYFIVLECMEGGELFDYIVANNFLSEREAASIINQVAEALAFLCKHCIVHRDIKPENILFYEGIKDNLDDLEGVEDADAPHSIEFSVVKLADFGLADKVKEPSATTLTSPCGTPGYVAPEVLTLSPYGCKVDTWSLGVIAFILLCGYPPFYSEDQDELFKQIKYADYEFGMPYWENVSEDAKETIKSLLIVDPSERLSAEELLELSWVKNPSTQSEKQLGSHVVEGINEVRQDKRFQKVALAIHVVNAFRTERKASRIVQAVKQRRASSISVQNKPPEAQS